MLATQEGHVDVTLVKGKKWNLRFAGLPRVSAIRIRARIYARRKRPEGLDGVPIFDCALLRGLGESFAFFAVYVFDLNFAPLPTA